MTRTWLKSRLERRLQGKIACPTLKGILVVLPGRRPLVANEIARLLSAHHALALLSEDDEVFSRTGVPDIVLFGAALQVAVIVCAAPFS